jgi:hypothetical protein
VVRHQTVDHTHYVPDAGVVVECLSHAGGVSVQEDRHASLARGFLVREAQQPILSKVERVVVKEL